LKFHENVRREGRASLTGWSGIVLPHWREGALWYSLCAASENTPPAVLFLSKRRTVVAEDASRDAICCKVSGVGGTYRLNLQGFPAILL
jgi:hypothetical protein